MYVPSEFCPRLIQSFAQDAEVAATEATHRNASLERELLALQHDTEAAAAEQAQKLEETSSALKEAQEAATAAEEKAREASQKQAEAEDAAQKAVAAEVAKEEAAQLKVCACVFTLHTRVCKCFKASFLCRSSAEETRLPRKLTMCMHTCAPPCTFLTHPCFF